MDFSVLTALLLVAVVASAQPAALLEKGRRSVAIEGEKSEQIRVLVSPGQFLGLTVSVWQSDAAVVSIEQPSGEVLYRFHPIGDLHDAYYLPLTAPAGGGEYVLTIKGSGPQIVFEVVASQQRPVAPSDEERIRLLRRLINAMDKIAVDGGKEPPADAIAAASEFHEWCKSVAGSVDTS